MQRLLDICLSFLALVVLSPLLVPICIVLKLTGEGKIFYLQERIGKGARPFKIYKFATMLKDSPNIASGTVTIQNDPRVLPVGGFLRKAKINELPQLLNILIGDMSVIGPRPVTNHEFELYDDAAKAAIGKLRPGLSGIGSVIFRHEESLMSLRDDPREVYRELISPYKGQLEQWFSQWNTLTIYFLLIFLTIWVVLFSKSQLVWKLFGALPIPPVEIRSALNYPG